MLNVLRMLTCKNKEFKHVHTVVGCKLATFVPLFEELAIVDTHSLSDLFSINVAAHCKHLSISETTYSPLIAPITLMS